MNTHEISPKSDVRLNRIKMVSDVLKIFFLVVAVVYSFYALALIGGVIMQKHYATSGQIFGNRLDTGCDIARQIARVILIGFCYQLFALISRGELVTSKIVRCIRFIGCAYLLIALTVFPQALLAMKDDSKMIIPHFISSLFVSFLFLSIAWILNVSLKIKGERGLTV